MKLAKWILILSISLLLIACGARRTPTSATSSHKDEYNLVMKVAQAAKQANNWSAAINLYQRAHQLKPRKLQPLITLGKIYREHKSYQKAQEVLKTAYELAPNDKKVLEDYAETALLANNTNLALSLYQQLLSTKPNSQAYNGLGVFLDRSGRHSAAQLCYRRGLRYNATDSNLINNISLSYLYTGQYKQANHIIKRALANPTLATKDRKRLLKLQTLLTGLQLRDSKQQLKAQQQLRALGNNLAFKKTVDTEQALKIAEVYCERLHTPTLRASLKKQTKINPHHIPKPVLKPALKLVPKPILVANEF